MDSNETTTSTLNAVRTRAEDIINRISQLQLNLERNRPQWPEVLEQLAVLSAQFSSLYKDMNPKLNHFVIQPISVLPHDPNQIPELLRTKTLPEIESEEQQMIQQFDSITQGKTDSAREAILKEKIEQYNEVCDDADAVFEELKEQLNLKTKYEPIVTETNLAALRAVLIATSIGSGLKQAPPPPVKAAPPAQGIGAPTTTATNMQQTAAFPSPMSGTSSIPIGNSVLSQKTGYVLNPTKFMATQGQPQQAQMNLQQQQLQAQTASASTQSVSSVPLGLQGQGIQTTRPQILPQTMRSMAPQAGQQMLQQTGRPQQAGQYGVPGMQTNQPGRVQIQGGQLNITGAGGPYQLNLNPQQLQQLQKQQFQIQMKQQQQQQQQQGPQGF